MGVPVKKSALKDKLSLPLFSISILCTLAVALVAMRILLPQTWKNQWSAGWAAFLAVFLLVHLGVAFFEFFFHRYVLHAVLMSLLEFFAKRHRRHHGLTPVQRQDPQKTGAAVPVRNLYPILEQDQYEASSFPYYSLGVFLLLISLPLALCQWAFPHLPFLAAGYLAMTWSMVSYELIHAVEHLPLETWWRMKLTHPRWGRLWERVYGFHLAHHACIKCNESIGGFFGLPISDMLFGTDLKLPHLPLPGSLATLQDFSPPRPVAFIRWLDAFAEQREVRRRTRLQAIAIAKTALRNKL